MEFYRNKKRALCRSPRRRALIIIVQFSWSSSVINAFNKRNTFSCWRLLSSWYLSITSEKNADSTTLEVFSTPASNELASVSNAFAMLMRVSSLGVFVPHSIMLRYFGVKSTIWAKSAWDSWRFFRAVSVRRN